MAYCKERILKNLMMGKQMTAAELIKLLRQGKSAVKAALVELKREKYVKVVRYQSRPLGGPKIATYAWSGKPISDMTKPTKGYDVCNTRIMAALEREPMMSVAELSVESGYSVAFTRKMLNELHELDKVRIAGWRPSKGTTMRLYGLANGEPDAEFVREVCAKTLQNRRLKAEAEKKPTVIKPRRDPAAAWF